MADEAKPTAAASWLDRLSERQMAVAVIVFGLLLYLPFAGSYGLWDPWETHYAEVARQMTARGDFISLWWPGSPRDLDVFWSKPVLSFWLMSLAMHIAGIGSSDGAAAEMALGTRAEWAARTPFCLMGVLGIVAVYWLTARFVSRRAGVLAAVVLGTSPMYSLVARQAMTDMAFVGPMAMALALGAMALFDDGHVRTRDERGAGGVELLPRKGRSWWSWPHDTVFYATVGLFALTVLPQLIVFSIQLRMEVPWGDRTFVMLGIVPMIPYFVGFAAFLLLAARTRSRAPLYLYPAAILCGLAVLAKGLAGLGVPLIVFLAYLLFTWSWARLRRPELLYALAVSALACVVVAAPWHHAMLIRHGYPFWNELFGDNHWRRMVLGRHGDRGTFEYFLRELGYAVLPWVALAPGALAWAVMRRGPRSSRLAAEGAPAPRPHVQEVLWLGAIWFVCTYALVSISVTKFHHYVLPAIPGLAICIGCLIDDLLGMRSLRRALVIAACGVPLLGVIAADVARTENAAQRFLWLFSYDYINSPAGRPWPDSLRFSGTIITFVVLVALATLALASRRARRMAPLALGTVATLFTFFLLDKFMVDVAPYWSQKNVIGSYYRLRRSPEERLIAYQMYWRGETFYTKNEIYEGPADERTVFDMQGADERLRSYLDRHRGRRLFFLFERGQQAHVRSLIPAERRDTFQIVDDHSNKFHLAQVDL